MFIVGCIEWDSLIRVYFLRKILLLVIDFYLVVGFCEIFFIDVGI